MRGVSWVWGRGCLFVCSYMWLRVWFGRKTFGNGFFVGFNNGVDFLVCFFLCWCFLWIGWFCYLFKILNKLKSFSEKVRMSRFYVDNEYVLKNFKFWLDESERNYRLF